MPNVQGASPVHDAVGDVGFFFRRQPFIEFVELHGVFPYSPDSEGYG
jgi:hypothetical protein